MESEEQSICTQDEGFFLDLLIAIIKMMQNVVECYCKRVKKETEIKNIVHTV